MSVAVFSRARESSRASLGVKSILIANGIDFDGLPPAPRNVIITDSW